MIIKISEIELSVNENSSSELISRMMLPAFNTFTYGTGYTDLRKRIDGLISIVTGIFYLDPTEAGSIFLFCGRRNDRMKVLLYEGDGWLLCYKRFTDGGLQWPRSEKEASDITPQQYRWIMEGLFVAPKKRIVKRVEPPEYTG